MDFISYVFFASIDLFAVYFGKLFCEDNTTKHLSIFICNRQRILSHCKTRYRQAFCILKSAADRKSGNSRTQNMEHFYNRKFSATLKMNKQFK